MRFLTAGYNGQECYLNTDHPLQQEITREVASLAGRTQSDLWFGTDGCSAPNIGLPLRHLAMMWARLAGGYSGESAAKDAVLRDIFSALAAYPEMVCGTGRLDLAIARLSDGDCIAKAGVDGIYTVGVKSRGLGIAIKVADGALSVLYATAVAVLEQLKVVEQLNELSLSRWNDPVIRNLRGIEGWSTENQGVFTAVVTAARGIRLEPADRVNEAHA